MLHISLSRSYNKAEHVPGVPLISLPSWALSSATATAEPVYSLAPESLPANIADADPAAPDPWESAIEPGNPCPTCGGLQPWVDGLGRERCGLCEGGKLRRAILWARRASAWRLARPGTQPAATPPTADGQPGAMAPEIEPSGSPATADQEGHSDSQSERLLPDSREKRGFSASCCHPACHSIPKTAKNATTEV